MGEKKVGSQGELCRNGCVRNDSKQEDVCMYVGGKKGAEKGILGNCHEA